MIAIPAIDLRGGACVQLVGGSYDAERVRLPDPEAVMQGWSDTGFRRLHLVDLDAATGAGTNRDLVLRLLARARVDVQVGGGVRTSEHLDALLSAGASRVLVGTRALEDPAWLHEVAARWPARIAVAVDVREGKVSLRGWTQSAPRTLDEIVHDLNVLPLAGLFVTSVDVEGRQRGPDLALTDRVLALTALPVAIAGGVTTLADLRTLRARGVSAAIIGMALYTGTLDPTAVAQEFGA